MHRPFASALNRGGVDRTACGRTLFRTGLLRAEGPAGRARAEPMGGPYGLSR